MRYAYALTAALLIGGTAATIAFQGPIGAQEASKPAPLNSAIPQTVPPAGAPMSFANLAERLAPAVVNISTRQRLPSGMGSPFDESEGRPGGTSLGSGFIISTDGYVVTNAHVISGGRDGNAPVGQITVRLADRREFAARLVGRDTTSDIALLKIDTSNLPFVRFGDSARARVGDWVLAIGNPFGLGGTVTTGIVSAIHRSIGGGPADRYIQTDAAINQGNSGGPMFDLNGNVIGINTAIISPTGGSVGIGFAIPAEIAKPVVDTLMRGKTVQRGYLGVQLQQLDDDTAEALGVRQGEGELVMRVEPGQGAAKAGIQRGDIIVRVNNRDVTPDETLSYIVSNLPIGARVPIVVLRNGKRVTLEAQVGQRPSDEQLAGLREDGSDNEATTPDPSGGTAMIRDALGMSVQPLTPVIGQQLGISPDTVALVIAAVDPRSDAGAKGIARGDLILGVGNTPVSTVAQLADAVRAAQTAKRGSLPLLIQKEGIIRYVGVRFKGQ